MKGIFASIAVVGFLLTASAQTQSSRPSNEEVIAKSEKDLDAKLLKNLPKIHVGFVSLENTGENNNEMRKVVFDILSRYNLPAEWTPTAHGFTVDVPTIVIAVTSSTTRWGNGATLNRATVRLELWDKLKLVRDPKIELSLPVWSKDEEYDFDSVMDRNTLTASMKSLTERFCLSYLSANR